VIKNVTLTDKIRQIQKFKAMTNPEIKRLYRSKTDRMLGGVCGGMGVYFNLDPVLMRLVWVILFFAGGIGVLGYILAWIIIPEEPS